MKGLNFTYGLSKKYFVCNFAICSINFVNMKNIIFVFIIFIFGCSLRFPMTPSESDLQFDDLATVWDEAMPLGNADVGVLVWQKGSSLRFSLDRIDLWDLRPIDSLQKSPTYSFQWIVEQVKKGDLQPIQGKFEKPFDMPGPSKIPGGALEFNSGAWGDVINTRLYLKNALCTVEWENGTSLKTFVQANNPIGWFVFENAPEDFELQLIPPAYNRGGGLARLGYEQGSVIDNGNTISYRQKGYGDFYYDIAVKWYRRGRNIVGTWSVTSSISREDALQEVHNAMKRGVNADYRKHQNYWNSYWDCSEIVIPDSVLQNQYDREIYKFGSVARNDSYPISLQAVWTADDGNLPPWKGDYHHDLNTQLSYWPAYSGNRLNEGLGYLNTLWSQRDVYRQFTKDFFGKDGINIPGACTLDGYAIGGWTQNSFSQTTAAWVAHHFYLHWKYSADKVFLEQRGYPFMRDVAIFLELQTIVNDEGVRTLELSTSPEIYGNSLTAWFRNITNYDLALIKFVFRAAAEMADALGIEQEVEHWKKLEKQLPEFSVDKNGALCFAPGFPYNVSHRHMSHAMAIHPLGLLDVSNGDKDRKIIEATLDALYEYGPAWWTGYTYSWIGNLEARAGRGEKAAAALRTFAECFCLKNSFHANGDQTKSGKSNFHYRPFTLEGNFAFAAGIQEMLIQSHSGIITLFPAIPAEWRDVKFSNLRTVGAFLVSAEMKDGEIVSLIVKAEKGGELNLRLPRNGELVKRVMKAGERVRII